MKSHRRSRHATTERRSNWRRKRRQRRRVELGAGHVRKTVQLSLLVQLLDLGLTGLEKVVATLELLPERQRLGDHLLALLWEQNFLITLN